jgi:transcriptional regulator with XRE-family HTH domain
MPEGRSPLGIVAAAHGLSLREVARLTGYKPRTIRRVSRGACAPWPELRRRLTDLFGFDPYADDGAPQAAR